MLLGRDVMSLPIRKRKLYLRDDDEVEAAAAEARERVSASDLSQGQRMSSVIQFAKAS